MKRLNQIDMMRKYRRINVGLALVFIGLLIWVGALFFQEIRHKQQQINAIQSENFLQIERQKNTLVFRQENGQWQMSEPFKSLASATVVDAFLQRLHSGCRQVDEKSLSRQLRFYATARTADADYQIGEVNAATDSVYVKTLSANGQAQQLALCDKLLASMALAPAINFIDKQLYQGKLQEIRGSFGSLSDFSGIDLSVLQVAAADAKQAKIAGISDLIFISRTGNNMGEKTYRVLPPDEKGQHILLFEPQKSLIYVIAANAKINAILGL